MTVSLVEFLNSPGEQSSDAVVDVVDGASHFAKDAGQVVPASATQTVPISCLHSPEVPSKQAAQGKEKVERGSEAKSSSRKATVNCILRQCTR